MKIMNKFRKIYYKITGLDKIISDISEINNKLDSLKIELHKDTLEKAIEKYYQSGFEYHQNEFKNDEVIKAWVLKKNYFN